MKWEMPTRKESRRTEPPPSPGKFRPGQRWAQTRLGNRSCGSWRWEANKLAEAQEYTAGDPKTTGQKYSFAKKTGAKSSQNETFEQPIFAERAQLTRRLAELPSSNGPEI